jgi:hypothetical protein
MALISADGDLTFCPGQTRTLRTGYNPLLSYQWYLNDVAISGANASTYAASEAGNYKVEVTRTGAPTSVSEVISLNQFNVTEVSIGGIENNYCISSTPVTPILTPFGGTLSGPGFFENTFIPAIAGLGQHQITYTYVDVNGCANTASTTVSVEECLSIADANKLGIEILPNPFHGSFSVRFAENENPIQTLEVYSINGQKLKSLSIENAISNQQIEIDLSNQAAGIYFLHLKGSAKQHVIKLVQE